MKIFGFASAVALVLLSLAQLTNSEVVPPSCIDFTKGDFGPETPVDDPTCQVACQTAEGLPVGRFTSEGDFFKKCTCLKIEENGSASETRNMCQDGAPSSGAGINLGTGMRLAMSTTLLVALLFV